MTHISTLTKFPESMLATMFNHQNQGLAAMVKTKDGDYFLDANPMHFREILHLLRYGKIAIRDSSLMESVKDLANFLGLTTFYTFGQKFLHFFLLFFGKF